MEAVWNFTWKTMRVLFFLLFFVVNFVRVNSEDGELEVGNDDNYFCWTNIFTTIIFAVCASFSFKLAFETGSMEKKIAARRLSKPCNTKSNCECENKSNSCCQQKQTDKTIQIFFATQTGTSIKFAELLKDFLQEKGFNYTLSNLKDFESEEKLLELAKNKHICVFILSTYTDGGPPEEIQWFYQWLNDTVNDFRVQKSLLKGMRYSVAKNVDQWMHEMQAQRLMPLGLGDENVAESEKGGIEHDFDEWQKKFISILHKMQLSSTECCDQPAEVVTEDEEIQYEDTSDEEDSSKDEKELVDVEDLGVVVSRKNVKKSTDVREMITPTLRTALTKQGYRLIGSHSGVKLCRWTKSMLRGRGGCYKHTFYGIASHQCMETTPSLACANKCVFCWRHHSNPVGTEWKWKMDQPETILDRAMQAHYKMINEFKGVPGVKDYRIAEGMKIRHCALSLVGEPIMYPEINKFVSLLHSHGISSFLVTNAQFPDAIKDLVPVTQLYVSVDASTKDSLKKIDRPLFSDFWPRFLASLKALSDKGQRTVYRLTLVKAWNVEELAAYAELVTMGNPDFIEIKGVTYCGTSKASKLTMENVPWHEEVVEFGKKLINLLPEYGLACEHAHSNCILMANKKFQINGEWHTWIDYDKFHELIKDPAIISGEKTFNSLNYVAQTPYWAVYGSDKQGFDPDETRWYRKNNKDISGC
uniref:S-adenosyl-L-methionine-dependent tRNA 4-demethylwyosine synthase TYW1 n=1 Tax=Strigamia maritima TaxID=126957 RepID=T1J2J5_STRMM